MTGLIPDTRGYQAIYISENGSIIIFDRQFSIKYDEYQKKVPNSMKNTIFPIEKLQNIM